MDPCPFPLYWPYERAYHRLGLELGRCWEAEGDQIFVTGRSPKKAPDEFTALALKIDEDISGLQKNLDDVLAAAGHIDLLIYAAGFLEQGHIDQLSDEHIVATINTGVIAPALLVKRILIQQGQLDGFIAITSTSQWHAREKEPTYCASKAGLAMLAHSLSLDPRIKKTLVVGPGGMKTQFGQSVGRDTKGYLEPGSVAEEILRLWGEPYSYRLARILREPQRVEILETE